jgi:hypothetical protein
MKKETQVKNDRKTDDKEFPGYPHYAKEEDIYANETEEADLDPEDPEKIKAPNEDPDAVLNEKNFEEDVSGADLDIPGNEQDEENLGAGLEDEENNFYSLGGDNHENLEESGDKI